MALDGEASSPGPSSLQLPPAAPAARPSGGPQECAQQKVHENESSVQVLRHVLSALLSTSRKEGFEGPPFIRRVRLQVAKNGLRLKSGAVKDVTYFKNWVLQGGTLRILLTIAALSITGCAATGSLLFGLIFAVATANAMAVALVLCLAAACSFLAMFLAALSAIYVGVLVSSATVIGFITLIAMSAAIGLSLTSLAGYLTYRAASAAFQYLSAKSRPRTTVTGPVFVVRADQDKLKET